MSVWECGRTCILGYVTRQYLKTNSHIFFHHLTKMSSWTPVTQRVGVAFHDNTAQNWLYLSCVGWKPFLFFFPTLNLLFYISGFVFFYCSWNCSRRDLHLPNVSGFLLHPCVSAFVSRHPSLSLHGGWVASVATAGALAACFSFS